ncbi:MAG: aminodeoxychorismate/anthranilate synthase component II [Deltaproteobacteria bacterium]|nr:aminodeoxychorismate/anthranilate synthase component II [Deltaproteobacteria bacterium]
MTVNVLFIDNYDSFSFNLVDDLRQRGAKVEVWRNDLAAPLALERALGLPAPRLILISPGPGRPEHAGCSQQLVSLALGKVPLFGVCLGLQAMVQALGGSVGRSEEVVHGKSARVEHDQSELFTGLSSPLVVGRYHSLVATKVPASLEVTARKDQLVMAIRHRQYAMLGVQFHPESVLTAEGGPIIDRLLAWAALPPMTQKNEDRKDDPDEDHA